MIIMGESRKSLIVGGTKRGSTPILIANTDYPALYQAADSTSIGTQKRYICLVSFLLILLVTALPADAYVPLVLFGIMGILAIVFTHLGKGEFEKSPYDSRDYLILRGIRV